MSIHKTSLVASLIVFLCTSISHSHPGVDSYVEEYIGKEAYEKLTPQDVKTLESIDRILTFIATEKKMYANLSISEIKVMKRLAKISTMEDIDNAFEKANSYAAKRQVYSLLSIKVIELDKEMAVKLVSQIPEDEWKKAMKEFREKNKMYLLYQKKYEIALKRMKFN